MTPDRLRACLSAIGWSQNTLAAILRMGTRDVRRWAQGATPIPRHIAGWLDRVGRYHMRNPPPIRNISLDNAQRSEDNTDIGKGISPGHIEGFSR